MNRGFATLHPLTCFLYYFGMAAFCMMFLQPIYLSIALLAMILLNLAQDGGKQLKGYAVPYLIMGLMTALANPLLSHRGRHMLFYLFDQPITLEAILYGVTMALSLLCVLVAFVSYNQVITSGKFLFLFSKLFRRLTLLTMLAIRFVPLLKRRLHQISMVQKTRGIDPASGSLRKRAKDGAIILQLLLTWSLEEALQTADSMRARGYEGQANRTSYVPYQVTNLDKIVLALLGFTGCLTLTGWFMGYGKLTIYPRLGSLTLQRNEWIFLTSFLIFIFVPIVIEGGKNRLWRKSN
jgi:energy-coupling factor transport system permease protein